MILEIKKGNIKIPDRAIRKYDLREDDKLECILENDRIILMPIKNQDSNYLERLKDLTDETLKAYRENENE